MKAWKKRGALVVAGLALALGLVHGWLNGVGIASAGRVVIGLVGIGGYPALRASRLSPIEALRSE